MGSFGFILLIVIVAYVAISTFGRITVFEYERAIRYERGRFHALAGPGLYWFFPVFTRFVKIDMRPRFAVVSGQEMLSADGIAVKISAVMSYGVDDPVKAVNSSQDYADAIYTHIQLALRQAVATMQIDDILAGRDQLAKTLSDHGEKVSPDLGLAFISAEVRDIMLPGKLRETFAQVAVAKKEALAAIERARGETAALRCLANAAKMVDTNPNLLQLRVVQAISSGTGNTVVFNPAAAAAARGEAGKVKPQSSSESGREGAEQKGKIQ